MSYENRAQSIGATSLIVRMVRSACETPTTKCELDCGGDISPLLDLNGTVAVEPQLVDFIVVAMTKPQFLYLSRTVAVEPQLVDLIWQIR